MKYPARILLIVLAVLGISYALTSKIIVDSRYYMTSMRKVDFLVQDSTKYDLVYLGSSSTFNTINPYYVDSLLGIKSYNLGMTGANIIEQRMIFNLYLSSHPAPKAVVITLDLVSFNDDRRLGNSLFYLTHASRPEIAPLLKKEGFYPLFFSLLPYLKVIEQNEYYKSFSIKRLKGQPVLAPGEFMYQGYLSNTNVCIDDNYLRSRDSSKHTEVISPTSVMAFNDMIILCRKKGINIILTYAPEYRFLFQEKIRNRNAVFKFINYMKEEYKLSFWRHDSLSMCSNPKLFANVLHVNTYGGQVYSRIMAKELQATGFFKYHL